MNFNKYLTTLFLILSILLISGCVASNNNTRHAIDLKKNGYTGIVTKEAIAPITLQPAGSYTKIMREQIGNEISINRTEVYSSSQNGFIKEKMTSNIDDFQLHITVTKQPNGSINTSDYYVTPINSENKVPLNAEDEAIFDLVIDDLLSGMQTVGDYALTKALKPNDTFRCFNEELAFEKILVMIHENSGNRGRMNVNTTSECTYIGTTEFRGERVAVFDESVAVTGRAQGLNENTYIIYFGWRMISLQNGLVVNQKAQGELVYDDSFVSNMISELEILY